MDGKVIGTGKISTNFRICITPVKRLLDVDIGDHVKYVRRGNEVVIQKA